MWKIILQWLKFFHEPIPINQQNQILRKMHSTINKNRPSLLTWLCVGSGFVGFMWIIMFIAIMIYNYKGNIPSGLFPGIVVEYMNAGYVFMLTEIFLTLLGLTGVLLMWQLKKSGLYIYALMKITSYFLPVIFIGINHLTFPGLILTSILIVLYGVVLTNNRTNASNNNLC